MNFLAHCALAHDTAHAWRADASLGNGLLAGAVIGDFVKGAVDATWPPELRAGVRLHRRVDALSNRNSGLRQSASRFPEELRRFAPILVDMLADHFLTHRWRSYYEAPLGDFTAVCYEAIETYAEFLGPDGQRFFEYMRDVDLLANYDEWPHVRRGYRSVLRRLGRPEWLHDCERASKAILSDAALDFETYYPELRDDCAALARRELLGED